MFHTFHSPEKICQNAGKRSLFSGAVCLRGEPNKSRNLLFEHELVSFTTKGTQNTEKKSIDGNLTDGVALPVLSIRLTSDAV